MTRTTKIHKIENDSKGVTTRVQRAVTPATRVAQMIEDVERMDAMVLHMLADLDRAKLHPTPAPKRNRIQTLSSILGVFK